MANIYDQFDMTPPATAASQPTANPYDVFDTPAQTAPPPVPETARSAMAQTAPPNPYDVFDEPSARITVEPSTAAPAASAASPGAISRGLVTGFMAQNPTLYAEFLEGVADYSPDMIAGKLRGGAQSLREIAVASPQDYALKSKGLFESGSLDEVMTALGEGLGAGLASMTPTVAGGVAGAGLGAAVGGPVGATVGGVAGVLASGGPLNFGEMRQALRDEGVEDKLATKYAAQVFPVLMGLDVAGLAAGPAGRLVGIDFVKKEASKYLARRVAGALASGFRSEGITELLQQAVQEMNVSARTDKPFWTLETAKKVAEAGIVGGVTGAAVGGSVGAFQKPSVPQEMPSSEALQQIFQDNVVAPIAAASGGVVYEDDTFPLPEAEKLQAAVSGNEARSATAAPKPSPTFYSRVEEVVRKGPESASAAQWNATILQAPGVKDAELEHLGLNRVLADEEGNSRSNVSKQELLDYIQENQINVKTTIKQVPEGYDVDIIPSRWSARSWTDADGAFEIKQENDGFHIERIDGESTPDQLDKTFLTLRDANNAIAFHYSSDAGMTDPSMPLYGNYDFPGAARPSAYVETVYQLPVKNEDIQIDPQTQKHFDTVMYTVESRYPGMKEEILKIAQQGTAFPREWRGRLTQFESDAVSNFLLAYHNAVDESANVHREPHWNEPNVWGHSRGHLATDVEGNYGFYLDEVQSDQAARGRVHGFWPKGGTWSAKDATAEKTGRAWLVKAPDGTTKIYHGTKRNAIAMAQRDAKKVTDFPFKKNWLDVMLKAKIRWAVDQGLERIYFPPSSVHLNRYPGMNERQKQGKRDLYDKILPNAVERIAKQIGATTGMTKIQIPGLPRGSEMLPVRFISLHSNTAATVRKGMTMFNRVGVGADPQAETRLAVDAEVGADPSLVDAAMTGGEVVLKIAKLMGIKKPITIKVLGSTKGRDLGKLTAEDTSAREISWEGNYASKAPEYTIRIWPRRHNSSAGVMASLMHELSHIVIAEHFYKAPLRTRLAVAAAFEDWRRTRGRAESRFRQSMATRDNFVTTMTGERFINFDPGEDPTYMEMAPEDYEYFTSMAEWLAEQTTKWMVTDIRPMSIVEKFFSRIAAQIKKLRAMFEERFGLATEPNQALAEWLSSIADMNPLPYAEERRQTDAATLKKAQSVMNRAGNPHTPVSPQTSASTGIREILEQLRLTDPVPGQVSATLVDHFNWFYKYMVGLVQLSDLNPHIGPLRRYRETWELMQLERAEWMNKALTTLKGWKLLSKEENNNLAAFMDYYLNMNYLTQDEADNGVVRLPYAAEIQQMATQFNLTSRAASVFAQIRTDFNTMLSDYEALLLAEADRIQDNNKRVEAQQNVRQTMARLRAQPYLPAMRFGHLSLIVKDAAGKMLHFETHETKRRRRAARRELEKKIPKGAQIFEGEIPEDARPFIGMPAGLLDLMDERLNLSASQRTALEYLRFELSPAQSFKHRFQMQNKKPGYSLDWQRAYANFFFHGSNYLTRVKYKEALQKQVKDVRVSGEAMPNGTKRQQIANFMQNHMQYMMDPKPDWGILRSIATLWALGASPAAATLNLSQMFVGSYPFLASKFGDLKAPAALLRAGRQVSTYYTKGKLENATEEELMALDEGVKQGTITEAQVPELAAATEYDNLQGMGRISSYSIFSWVLEKSMFMFSMTEQMNRRITFRAAWALAKENPAAPYVDEAVRKHRVLYERLRLKGGMWTEANARAFVVAKDTVDTTQYIYAQWAQPRFMRGKWRTVFVFKTFVQNTLFMLWNHPGTAVRSIAVMAALGGLMGLPGAEDIAGIMKVILRRVFGKDTDVEELVRHYVIDLTNGNIPPDLVLHGMARRGFGIPAAMDLVGVPAPVFDRSKAIGLGHVLPFDVGVLAGEGRDQSRAIADSVQRASGAAYGIGFNLYKFIFDSQHDFWSTKRWQMMLPRSAASAAKAYRYYNEGQETNRYGDTVIRFDVNDPRQLMEVIATGLGYQSFRLSAQWDRIMAEREGIMFWNTRREGLLRQLWQAHRANDDEQYDRVMESIGKFNRDLPDVAVGKAISRATIKRSFQSRARATEARESGTPRVRADVPIVREIQRLHPEAEVDVRKVR